jgi:hypothetical protein
MFYVGELRGKSAQRLLRDSITRAAVSLASYLLARASLVRWVCNIPEDSESEPGLFSLVGIACTKLRNVHTSVRYDLRWQ